MTRALLQIAAAGALTAFASLSVLPVQAQIKKGCSSINYVGADASNPFTAEHVTTSAESDSSGAQKTTQLKEYIARDGRGRIRFEKHDVARTADDRKTIALEWRDGTKFTVTQEEYGTLIDIFDCESGITVRIQPGMRIVTVKEDPGEPPTRRAHHAFSTPYIPAPGMKLPPNKIVEPLGNREIQGIQARGVKTITLGTTEDGDWNGKPIREEELWLSDELAARMLWIHKDLRKGTESRGELLAIKRDNPDPALFEIPKDYHLNPSMRGGLPIMKSSNLPASATP
jgi:hypothetical protein